MKGWDISSLPAGGDIKPVFERKLHEGELRCETLMPRIQADEQVLLAPFNYIPSSLFSLLLLDHEVISPELVQADFPMVVSIVKVTAIAMATLPQKRLRMETRQCTGSVLAL